MCPAAVYAWIAMRDALRDANLEPDAISDPRIDPNGTDGWAALSLRAQRALGPTWTLTAALENVFDERYREHGSGIDAPGRGLVLELEAPIGD